MQPCSPRYQVRGLARAAGFALLLAPVSAGAQSVEGEPASDAAAAPDVRIVVREAQPDVREPLDEGVISTCSLYYRNAVVDCSHLSATRQQGSETVTSSIEPSPTMSSREELYPQRIAPSALAPSRLTAAPLPGSRLARSEISSVRSGLPELRSSLYVEPYDPARTYVTR